MTNYTLVLDKTTKAFGRRIIFKELSYTFTNGNVYGIAGKNGAGKSTLVKIIAGLISPTNGKINHFVDDTLLEIDHLHNHIGFVSPYLVLYDEFTAIENLFYLCKIRGLLYDKKFAENLLNEVTLFDRRNDLVKTYSSGMKQRLKYAFALVHSPSLIILDEPTSNLDSFGKDIVYNFINNLGKDKLVIVASNEQSDLAVCPQIIEIEKFNKL
ncbi:MAG: ABC transporter ATP-binding protein [bacterium]